LFLLKIADPRKIKKKRSTIFHTFFLKTENGHELGLGKAVRSNFLLKMISKTSPIDLDRFRHDLAGLKIQKIPEDPGSTISHRDQNNNF